MPLLTLQAPADFDEVAVRQHMDISNATENVLDVTEWVASASAPMASDQLHMRMGMVEYFLRDGIIEPVITGNTQTQPSAAST